MSPPDESRRRALLALASGMTLLAGCGDTDRTTPEPAPPPETGTPDPGSPGPGPGEETPDETRTPQQATGTRAPDDVVFSKPEGGEVSATLYGGGDCGVVLVPQVEMDRQSWDPYARELGASGYLAMAIDEGEQRKAAGVTAAVQYLAEERGVETVVAIGASAGAEAVLRASAENPEAVDGVVAISPAGGADVADQLTMPALVVVAEGDAHGQHLFDSRGEALRSRIGEFLAAVCGSASG